VVWNRCGWENVGTGSVWKVLVWNSKTVMAKSACFSKWSWEIIWEFPGPM